MNEDSFYKRHNVILHKAIKRLKEQREQLYQALKAVEWGGGIVATPHGVVRQCPCCNWWDDNGHDDSRKGCQLRAALDAYEKESE